MLTSFDGSHIEEDEYGQLWVHQNGQIRCEAFYQAEDESTEEMMDNGYILLPYQYKGQEVFVQVLTEDDLGSPSGQS